MIPDQYRPWAPIRWPENIPAVYALKALSDGTATADQQQLALSYIIHVVSKRNELPYYPDSDRDSAFAAGKMYVAQQIQKLIELKSDVIQEEVLRQRPQPSRKRKPKPA